MPPIRKSGGVSFRDAILAINTTAASHLQGTPIPYGFLKDPNYKTDARIREAFAEDHLITRQQFQYRRGFKTLGNVDVAVSPRHSGQATGTEASVVHQGRRISKHLVKTCLQSEARLQRAYYIMGAYIVHWGNDETLKSFPIFVDVEVPHSIVEDPSVYAFLVDLGVPREFIQPNFSTRRKDSSLDTRGTEHWMICTWRSHINNIICSLRIISALYTVVSGPIKTVFDRLLHIKVEGTKVNLTTSAVEVVSNARYLREVGPLPSYKGRATFVFTPRDFGLDKGKGPIAPEEEKKVTVDPRGRPGIIDLPRNPTPRPMPHMDQLNGFATVPGSEVSSEIGGSSEEIRIDVTVQAPTPPPSPRSIIKPVNGSIKCRCGGHDLGHVFKTCLSPEELKALADPKSDLPIWKNGADRSAMWGGINNPIDVDGDSDMRSDRARNGSDSSLYDDIPGLEYLD
jgi:hypothetical protein